MSRETRPAKECRQVDTPCFFGRDLDQFHTFAQAWFGQQPQGHENPNVSVSHETEYCREILADRIIQLPREVLYFTEPLSAEASEQKDVFMGFVSDVEKAVGVKALRVSIVDAWRARPPAEACDMPLTEYLNAEVRHSWTR